MATKVILTILFAIFLSWSCGPKQECKYSEGIKSYLAKEHKISAKKLKVGIFYIINIAGCEPCTDRNLKMLLSLQRKENLFFVMVGITQNPAFQSYLKQIEDKGFVIIKDPKAEIYSYEVGLGKPILIHIEDGFCINRIDVGDFDVDKAKDYISSH